jgi:hypothetical protein
MIRLNGWRRLAILVSGLVAMNASPATAQEVSLYASDGEPVAYIAVNDEMTIYLWDGEPVAYLATNMGSFNVYGFNGEHLGWFERGAIWMHDGNAACAIRQALTVVPSIESVKSIKSVKSVKSVRSIPPFKPLLTNSFGAMPCSLFLAGGK